MKNEQTFENPYTFYVPFAIMEKTLLGVTGRKTFAMANVIQQLNKTTLISAHNKTLAAQLYDEFKGFFRTMP